MSDRPHTKESPEPDHGSGEHAEQQKDYKSGKHDPANIHEVPSKRPSDSESDVEREEEEPNRRRTS
jgi:hypothetical protein